MAPLSLKIVKDKGEVSRKVKLDPKLSVAEALAVVREKFHDNIVGNSDYGLFLRSLDGDESGVWMEPLRTLEYYVLRDGDSVEYLSTIANVKVKMLDGTVKTLQVNQTRPVSDLLLLICSKLGIPDDEYGLCLLEEDEEDEAKENKPAGATGTLTLKKKSELRQKERDSWMEKTSKRLKTDDHVRWVDPHQTLSEAGVSSRTLLLKRKLYYSHANVDERDPVQLNLLYVQARDNVLSGYHPVTSDQAADCKVRWIHIRDVHRRIYRQSLIPGARRPRRAYKYDTLLEFMKMYYKEINAPTQSVNEESDNEIEEEKPTDNWDDVVIDYNHESEEEKPLKKRKKAQKKKTNSFEEVDVSACSVNEPLTAEFDTTDPVDSFLISIGNTLKKFSPYHLNVAKTKIFQIVQDFDLQQIIEKQGRGDASVSAANEQMYYQNEEILT